MPDFAEKSFAQNLAGRRHDRFDKPAPLPHALIQPKLMVASSDNPLEMEADQAADRIVNIWQNGSLKAPEGTSTTAPTQPFIQRRAVSPETGAIQAPPEVAQQIQSAQGGGQTLPTALQPSLEAAFGMDFSGVRLHTDTRADGLNRELQARAFTTGQDIFFRQGEYRPGMAEGVRLLGHELGHVGQQTKNTIRRQAVEAPRQTVSPIRQTIAQQITRFGGITVAVYAASGVRQASEFEGQAQRFAEDHGAIGIDRNGVLAVGCAMELNQSIGDILSSLQAQLDSLGLRATPGQPYIKNLAFFTHGLNDALQAGFGGAGRANTWVRNYEAWVRAFAPYISPDHPRILFYACSVSGAPSGGRAPFAQSIAQILQVELETRYPSNTQIEVETWGHLNPGPATASAMIGGFRSRSGAVMDFRATISRNLVTYILSHRETGGTGSASTRPQVPPSISPRTERRLNIQAERSFTRIFRSPPARYTSVNSPYNTYIREIYNLGFDTVWRQVSTTDPVDFRSMGYSDDAAARLERGLAMFRERFRAEVARIEEEVF